MYHREQDSGDDSQVAEITSNHCPKCGTALPAAGAACPQCSVALNNWMKSRGVFLSLCGIVVAPLFIFTGTIVGLFHAKVDRIALEWSTAGAVNLQAGEPRQAIEDFRNALLYSPNDTWVQLQLAQALMRQGTLDEAQSYLMNLRSRDPENALVNLALARVAVRRKNVEAAVNYYHDAIYGRWDDASRENRLHVREELSDFLVIRGQREAAQAEVLAMVAEYPTDPAVHIRGGKTLLQIGDLRGALQEFDHAQQLEPRNTEAILGAAQAAEQMGDLAATQKYLTKALLAGAKEPSLEHKKEVVTAALALDPFAGNLNDEEKEDRIRRIFTSAESRNSICFDPKGGTQPMQPSAAQTALIDERAKLPRELSASAVRKDPKLLDEALRWSFNVEKESQVRCGEGTVTDQAIALLGESGR